MLAFLYVSRKCLNFQIVVLCHGTVLYVIHAKGVHRPPLHVEIGMRLPSVPPLNLRNNRTQNLLLLPFAASFFCNFLHITQDMAEACGSRTHPRIRKGHGLWF